MSPRPAGFVLAMSIALTATGSRAAEVTLDGLVLAKATSSMSIPVQVTEFRELGQCPLLIPGCPSPEVCINAPSAVPSLDAQLAGAAPARFTVGVEDGRSFARCVLASLKTDGAGSKRPYLYCLRCESVSGP